MYAAARTPRKPAPRPVPTPGSLPMASWCRAGPRARVRGSHRTGGARRAAGSARGRGGRGADPAPAQMRCPGLPHRILGSRRAQREPPGEQGFLLRLASALGLDLGLQGAGSWGPAHPTAASAGPPTCKPTWTPSYLRGSRASPTLPVLLFPLRTTSGLLFLHRASSHTAFPA